MQEGYEFEVEFNGQTMIAVVVSQLIILTESKFHLYIGRDLKHVLTFPL